MTEHTREAAIAIIAEQLTKQDSIVWGSGPTGGAATDDTAITQTATVIVDALVAAGYMKGYMK